MKKQNMNLHLKAEELQLINAIAKARGTKANTLAVNIVRAYLEPYKQGAAQLQREQAEKEKALYSTENK